MANGISLSTSTSYNLARPLTARALGDIIGGAMGAVIVVPIILSCGSISYHSIGPEYTAAGISAAFITAVISALVAGLFGGAPLHVNSPKTSHAAILSGLIATIATHHSFSNTFPGASAPAALMSICFLAIIISGVCQFLLGLLRLGALVKFVPHPVLAGFINGFAIQIILMQLPKAVGVESIKDLGQSIAHPATINLWILSFSVLAGGLVWFAGHISKAFPSALIALAGGTLAHWLVGRQVADPASLGPVIGALPSGLSFMPKFGQIFDFTSTIAFSRHIFPIFATGATLALVSSIQSLLSISSTESLFGARHDSNRELMVQGASNALAGVLGGTPSGGSPNITQTVHANGGRTRFANLAHGATLLALSYGLSDFIAMIPLSVMSGVIIATTLGSMDRWTQQLLSNIGSSNVPPNRRSAAINLAIVLLVAALVVTAGALAALGMGMAVAFMVFLYRSNTDMIRRVFNAGHRRSRTDRSLAANDLLEAKGHLIVVIELEGPLFFGSAEAVVRAVEKERRHADWIILDCRRMSHIDTSGGMALKRLDEMLRKSGKKLLFSYLPEQGQRRSYLKSIGVTRPEEEGRIFNDTDQALSQAEDELLAQLGNPQVALTEIPLRGFAALLDLADEELWLLSKNLKRRRFSPGDSIRFGEGLLFLTFGRVSLFTATDERPLRLASFQSGVVLGEMAMFSPQSMPVNVVADSYVILEELTPEFYQWLCANRPAITVKLLRSMVMELGIRLRNKTQTICELET